MKRHTAVNKSVSTQEFFFFYFATQPHPDVKPMAYANSFMSMFGFM